MLQQKPIKEVNELIFDDNFSKIGKVWSKELEMHRPEGYDQDEYIEFCS